MRIDNKKFTALAVCLAAGSLNASGAILIAGIDTWDNTTAPTVSHVAPGVTASASASASTGNWSNGDSNGRGSSEDTTWGSFDGSGVLASTVTDVGPANFTVTNGRPTAEVTFTITNSGAAPINLAAFHMDAIAFRPNAPRTYALNVLAGSDITPGNVFTSEDPLNNNSTNAITHLGGGLDGHAQHEEIDLDLSGLADHTLASGESAQIQIAFSNGTGAGGGHHLFLDNVAISGDVDAIPEPSSVLMIGLSGLALLVRRRK